MLLSDSRRPTYPNHRNKFKNVSTGTVTCGSSTTAPPASWNTFTKTEAADRRYSLSSSERSHRCRAPSYRATATTPTGCSTTGRSMGTSLSWAAGPMPDANSWTRWNAAARSAWICSPISEGSSASRPSAPSWDMTLTEGSVNGREDRKFQRLRRICVGL